MLRKEWFSLIWVQGLVGLAMMSGVLRAQDAPPTCPAVQVGQDLVEPPVIEAKGGGIDTTFKVELKQLCVPVQNADKSWSSQLMTLRTYVYPDPQKPGEWRWGFPGPTLKVHKQRTPVVKSPKDRGDTLAILLVNNLQPDAGSACDSACPSTVTCPTNSADLPNPLACPAACNPASLCDTCCCWVNVNQTYPDCFHGDNTTNLHFHGTHVSPQPPQDYVLLELRPKDQKGTANDHPAHRGGIVAYGQYQYKIDPFPWTQAEGTHWYHPHKHGSVSLQVANGLPGALLIEGAFDEWLRHFYGGKLVERLMVLEQIEEETNLFNPNAPAPPVLVNGQVSPKVKMRPGEVQRWRFVNATMKVAAQLAIYFPAGTEVKQIAMDGVRFAPANYGRQPLLTKDAAGRYSIKISPGNRADFLVQAPLTTGQRLLTQSVFGNLGERAREKIQRRAEGLKALTGANTDEPPLLSLDVEEPGDESLRARPLAKGFPTQAQWPPMPEYLRDIPASAVRAKPNLTFEMTGGPGNPATTFLINGRQFNSDCVDVTTRLGTADEWTVANSSPLRHPFHIHTNPFQLIRDAGTEYKPPYIWQDTIALPAGTLQNPGSVILRHRYEEFTGEYVLHCHFLGHEDRGMMFAVQTVCKDATKSFGKARSDGKPECVPGNLIPAAPQCPLPPSSTSTAAPAGGHR